MEAYDNNQNDTLATYDFQKIWISKIYLSQIKIKKIKNQNCKTFILLKKNHVLKHDFHFINVNFCSNFSVEKFKKWVKFSDKIVAHTFLQKIETRQKFEIQPNWVFPKILENGKCTIKHQTKN